MKYIGPIITVGIVVVLVFIMVSIDAAKTPSPSNWGIAKDNPVR